MAPLTDNQEVVLGVANNRFWITKNTSKISSGSQTGFARSGPVLAYGEAVDVVGHEHETEQVPTEPPDRLLQSFEQPLIVTLVSQTDRLRLPRDIR